MTNDQRQGAHGPDGSQPRLERFQEFWPTSLALRHRTSTLVLLGIITFAGLFAYRTLPKESAPEIEVPALAISTIYPGVSAGDVETLVTRVLEEDLNTIADIKTLSSTSLEGYSVVTAEFEPSVSLDEALQKVREKVDLAKPDLPADAEEPIITEFNFAEIPIMQVNLSGEYGLVRLEEVAEDLRDRLEQIPSLLEVRLSGGLEREVAVDVDLGRLKYYGIALGDIVDAIRSENVNVPGGSIDVGSLKYVVRVDGEFVDPRVIEDVVITTKNGRPIYVRDVAEVSFGFQERASYARLDGNPVVTLDIVKRSGENIIETAEAVKATVAQVQAEFPPTTVVKITSDQSTEIETMVSSLQNGIVFGLILIFAVLLFFLGLRNAGFAAISIPTSLLLSFLVMQAAGMTVNMVVLFSLILALGLVVDDSIVVTEVIYRFMEQGFDRSTAARKAVGEVAVPVITSTLTTLAAFVPLLFWPGIVGEFMGYLPITMIIALTSSLFVALVIVPVVCALYMRPDHAPRGAGLTPAARWSLLGGAALGLLLLAAANVLTAVLLAVTAVVLVALHRAVLARASRVFQDRGFPAIIGRYERIVRWALDHRAAVLGGTAAAFVLTVVAFGALNAGIEFFPEDIPPNQAWIQIEAPEGTSADFTNDVALRVEQQLEGVPGMADAKSVVATVGGSGGDWFMGGGAGGPNTGRVMISFVDYAERSADAFATVGELQQRIGQGIAGADITTELPAMGPPSGAAVNIEIVGEDTEVLRRLADQAIATLEAAPVYAQLSGLESDLSQGSPELSVHVDREKAALYGLNTSKVAGAVRGAIQGIEAAKYRTGKDEYDIVVRLAESYRSDLNSLEDLTAAADGGRQIPLLSVADWTVGEGLGAIRRKDLDRVVTVSSDARAGYNSNAVLAEVQQTLADFGRALPSGYAVRYTGQQQEQQESQDFLWQAFLGGIMLIALILISEFNSV
ncbi:MAG: efflux RND transporter permease subunit, partial [Gemmatimonadetes bacterium]|nr:efflux RND transporter permease subunit [Gemmatimonadota bacterium]